MDAFIRDWLTTAQRLILRGRDESGQTMAEYGMLLAVIVIAVLVAAIFLGDSISSFYTDLSSALP